MSYSIKLHCPIGLSLQDVARDEIATLLQTLRTVKAQSQATTPRRVRKRIRKLRAVLALLASVHGKKLFHQEEATLRKIARDFRADRELTMFQTFEQLQRRFFPGKPPGLIRTIRSAVFADDLPDDAFGQLRAVEASLTGLQDLFARLGHWPVGDFGWKELRAALRRSYRRTQEAYQLASDAPIPLRLDRWRKRTRELCWQLRLLRDLCPTLVGEMVPDYEAVGEFLGEEHDLAELRTAIETRSTKVPSAAVDRMLGLIDLRREELLDAAFDLGNRLHEDLPTVFARELDARRVISRASRRNVEEVNFQVVGAA